MSMKKTMLGIGIFIMATAVVLMGCDKEASTETSTQASELGEPIVITMSAPHFEKNFPAGFQDDLVIKEIEKRLHIKLNIIPANAVGDVDARFIAQLASDDLPDITWVPAGGGLNEKVVSANVALPLDDLITQYGKDILEIAPFSIEFSKEHLSRDVNGIHDGKLYFISTLIGTESDPLQVQVAPYLRFDLWEKLGFPELKTMDDYLPVLKQMMELEPTNEHGESTYGVSAWFANSGWGNWSLQTPFAMFEGITISGVIGLDMVSKEVISTYTDPNSTFWKAMEWYNKANRIGVLDPDSFTMKFVNYLEKTAANRVFLGWAPWSIDGGNQTFLSNGQEERGYFQMPAPTDLDQYMISFEQPQGGQKFFISKSSKHPEKALELLNFLISYEGNELIYNGVKGVHWDEVDGRPVVRPETLEQFANDEDFRVNSGYFKYHNLAGLRQSQVNPKYGTPVNFRLMPELAEQRLIPIQKKGAKHFGVQLPADLYVKTKKYTSSDSSILASLPQQPDEIKDTMNTVLDYVDRNQFSLITIESEEQFQKEKENFIQELKRLGIEKVVQWYQEELSEITD